MATNKTIMNLTRITVVGCLAAFLLFGTGCQRLRPPESSTKMWIPSKRELAAEKTDHVWASIREQQIDSSQPLQLVNLIDIALDNNPSTREAWQEARAAYAAVKQAESQYYPQATASANVTKERNVADLESAEINDIYYGPSANVT